MNLTISVDDNQQIYMALNSLKESFDFVANEKKGKEKENKNMETLITYFSTKTRKTTHL